MHVLFLVLTGHDSPWDRALDILAPIVLGGWLAWSLVTGKLSYFRKTTAREDEPTQFWLGCGAIAALIAASVLWSWLRR